VLQIIPGKAPRRMPWIRLIYNDLQFYGETKAGKAGDSEMETKAV